jgi:anti-sigma B factor antagonist
MDDFKIDSDSESGDGIFVLRLSGPFTLDGLFEFQSVVRGVSDPAIIIDLTNVPYMDSASVGAIMSVHTSAQRNNRRYALVGVCDRIRTLFRVVGLEEILVTYPTLEEAQRKLGARAASS